MKHPLDGPIQPGDGQRPERLDDETRAKMLSDLKETKDMCLRFPEKIRATGRDPVKLLQQLDAGEVELARLTKRIDQAESNRLNTQANLADRVNDVAYDLVAFRIAIEKELPSLRAKLNATHLAEVEELLRDWHENREEFLKPLTAEQRRSLGV